ncbi:hypothetical protein B0T17DRAFT_212005 [Bombardia bombarda]|uniref:Uncharacterized protein n=1 Tax=Bombardia bombarda TaxID=252184 RepID=A0AA39XB18_9PEZI|nr:hypothetical protein B0T17DRAFT_212005 [Bombardia bombarda]
MNRGVKGRQTHGWRLWREWMDGWDVDSFFRLSSPRFPGPLPFPTSRLGGANVSFERISRRSFPPPLVPSLGRFPIGILEVSQHIRSFHCYYVAHPLLRIRTLFCFKGFSLPLCAFFNISIFLFLLPVPDGVIPPLRRIYTPASTIRQHAPPFCEITSRFLHTDVLFRPARRISLCLLRCTQRPDETGGLLTKPTHDPYKWRHCLLLLDLNRFLPPQHF